MDDLFPHKKWIKSFGAKKNNSLYQRCASRSAVVKFQDAGSRKSVLMTNNQTPTQILMRVYNEAIKTPDKYIIVNELIRENIEYVCRCMSNRAGVRLLMSCLLGKLHNPGVDIRKPYTEIGTIDCFSGRTYDEHFLMPFITIHRLLNYKNDFDTEGDRIFIRNGKSSITNYEMVVVDECSMIPLQIITHLFEDVRNSNVNTGPTSLIRLTQYTTSIKHPNQT